MLPRGALTRNSRVRLLLASARYWLAVDDLQEPEAEEEDHEEDQRDAAEDRDAQGQPVAAAHLGAAFVGAQVHRDP